MESVKFCFLFFLFLATSCVTLPPVHFEDFDRGGWDGKVLIRDLKSGKSHVLNLEILSKRPHRLRVDVTSTLGVHVASLAMQGEVMTCLIVQERKYYQGRPEAKIMKELVRLELDPRVLVDVLFDLPPQKSEGWRCERDSDEYLTRCLNSKSRLEIKWQKRDGRERVLSFSSPESEVQLHLQNFQSKVEVIEEKFALKVPAAFTRL